MTKCTKCTKCNKEYKEITVSLKIIPTGRKEKYLAKYTIQLKKICPKGHYIKFAEQNPKVIEAINQQLEDAGFVFVDQEGVVTK